MKLELDIPDEMYSKIIEVANKEYRTPELQILYFIDKTMNAKNSSPLIYAPGVRSIPGMPNNITATPNQDTYGTRPIVTCKHKDK